MKKNAFILFVLICFFIILPGQLQAVSPVGHLDVVDGQKIAGWAKDEDYSGPIIVHIYIDGVFVQSLVANNYRSDVGNHGFRWDHASFGRGEHQVVVYAIGVNSSGNLDGDNPSLGGIKTFTSSCSELTGSAISWCLHNPNYWVTRQTDTKLLWNKNVKVGINKSYGGLITQLYSNDQSYNLINEHGGAAIQLSLWGYDSNSTITGWYGNEMNKCDPVLYSTEAECLNHNSSCRWWGHVDGEHVCDCSKVDSCVNWGAGAPWNPIQAQAENCLWEDPSNDVDFFQSVDKSFKITLNDPVNFTKSTKFKDLTFKQKVTLGDCYIKVDYQIDYDSAYVLTSHPQEIPAIFTNSGINHYFYYYSGSSPYQNPNSAVEKITHTQGSGKGNFIAFDSYDGKDEPFDHATERWWSVCNESETRCLTVATFSPLIEYVASLRSVDKSSESGAYITALGQFNLHPGFNKTFTVYFFPYKHNDVVNGKTIRQRIYELSGAVSSCATCPSGPAKAIGNANCDNLIDLIDFAIWLNIFKLGGNQDQKAQVNFDCQETDSEHIINLSDFQIWLENFISFL